MLTTLPPPTVGGVRTIGAGFLWMGYSSTPPVVAADLSNLGATDVYQLASHQSDWYQIEAQEGDEYGLPLNREDWYQWLPR